MQKTTLLCVMAVLCLLGSLRLTTLHAQNNYQPLTIGDKVPDVLLAQVLNHNAPTARLNDFKDKAIILDFWATWCAPCVAGLPKMDSLQKKFANDLQIIAITSDATYQVKRFFEQRWQGKIPYQFPFVINDTLLTRLLHYGTVPHMVWINKKGIIQSFTDHLPVTATNIAAFINGQPIKGSVKTRTRPHPTKLPLLINETLPHSNRLLFQSALTRWVENMAGNGAGSYKNGAYFKLYNYGFNIKKLYLTAFGKTSIYQNRLARVILEGVKDSSKYIAGIKKDNEAYLLWADKNLYNYEIILPVDTTVLPGKQQLMQQAETLMQADLNKYFGQLMGLKGSVQLRPVKCRIITVSNPALLVTGGAKTDLYRVANNLRKFINVPLHQIIENMGNYTDLSTEGKVPLLIDETGFTGSVDMLVDFGQLFALENARAELAKYGLQVQETWRTLEVIVLTETPTNP